MPYPAEPPAQTTTVRKARRMDRGWEVTGEDGWTFLLDAEYGVEPLPGATLETWGGLGRTIRGVRVGGQLAYYRTAEQEATRHRASTYGATPRDYLAKWDTEGRAWSVAMGGFGPGYEQALQLAMFEALRLELHPELTLDHDSFAAVPRVRALGLSGAQAGAAMSLARSIAAKGAYETLQLVAEDRRIQVSAECPSLSSIDRQLAQEAAGAQHA